MNPNLRLPFKRYEIGKSISRWANKEDFVNLYNATLISSVLSLSWQEAELMGMAFELFRTLNLEITIQYNNRKLLNGILQAINIPTELTVTSFIIR